MDVEVIRKLNLFDKEDLIKVKKKTGDPMKFVVTGGCGHVGFNLAKCLHKLGGKVVMADIRPPDIEDELTEDLEFIRTDITLYSEVVEAFQSADCVFHVASVGIKQAEQLDKNFTNKINVGGTRNVIKACVQCGITKLIYTSSYTVVFGYKPIINGDDFVPYSDPTKVFSYYYITKQQADKDVLAANMQEVKGGKLLRTCCLRPPGVVGPDEKYIVSRVVKWAKFGLANIDLTRGSIQELVHVDNLLQAHILAIRALSKSSNHIASGKAYFISDGEPEPAANRYLPFIELLSFTDKTIKASPTITYFFAYLSELIYHIVKPFFTFHPLFTRSDILNISVSHYQDISRVKHELGFNPRKYSWKLLVEESLKKHHPESLKRKMGNFAGKFLLVICGFIMLLYLININYD